MPLPGGQGIGGHELEGTEHMSRAFVFPGQGAQSIGMGRELAEAYPAAKAVFDEVDEALGEKLSALIWEGEAEELTLTQNAQPALMATSLAAMRALEAEGAGIGAATFVAGHSLGEYSALAAAGALGIGDAARLLRIRGAAMQKAVPVGEGAMAALLGLDFAAAQAVAEQAAQGEVCTAANDNDPAQVVVSGHKAAVERAAEASGFIEVIHRFAAEVNRQPAIPPNTGNDRFRFVGDLKFDAAN